MSRYGWASGLAWLAWAVCGCGGDGNATTSQPTVEVSGQVLRADDKPLTSARVTFIPQELPAYQASAELGPDGRFRLTTFADADGAVPGRYKVRIEPTGPEPATSGRRRAKPRVPARYTDEDSSGLVVTVVSGPNQLDPFRLR